jgi:hypothetical protein
MRFIPISVEPGLLANHSVDAERGHLLLFL